MSIFKICNSKLNPIKEKQIDLEKRLQALTEKNLQVVFGLEFISGFLNREFSVKAAQQDFYIDTLAFDPETKSFVIIEYKKDKNFSVIDQGYAYLGAMINNRADFVLEYNEKKKASLKKSDIDWRQSKIVFICPDFTTYQQSAIAFKDLPIELWKVTLYENNIVSYEQIRPPVAKGSIGEITPKSKLVKHITKEIKPYTLEEIFKRQKTSSKIKDLLSEIREQISSLGDDIDERFGKWAIIYKKHYKTFAYLHPRTKDIRAYLRLNEIVVSTKIGYERNVKEEDVFKIGFKMNSDSHLAEALSLIKDAYEKN